MTWITVGVAVWIPVGIAVVALLFLVGMYNRLIGRRNAVENAMGGLDAQLKMRYDLIPNLVATVRQYMQHEAGTLQKLTELRASATQANLPADDRIAAANETSRAIRGVMVAVENYPELRASENFQKLQGSLNEVEDRLSAARRAYNAAVTDFNDAVEMFPSNLMASFMGLRRKPVLETPEAERQNVNVGKLFAS